MSNSDEIMKLDIYIYDWQNIIYKLQLVWHWLSIQFKKFKSWEAKQNNWHLPFDQRKSIFKEQALP